VAFAQRDWYGVPLPSLGVRLGVVGVEARGCLVKGEAR
jgi:hypothetical protein